MNTLATVRGVQDVEENNRNAFTNRFSAVPYYILYYYL